MQEHITPCRNVVDDRFPVVSFVVRVPEDRKFEVACATDPRLFSPAWRGRRTESNFFSTRSRGLFQAVGGETTVVLPAQQLARFVGNRRLYYMLGSYSAIDPRDARFSVPPQAAEDAPFVRVAPDFTGRNLDRPVASYAGRSSAATLCWGGDELGGLASSHDSELPYDDGFEPPLPDRSRSYGYVIDPAAVVAGRRDATHPDEYGSALAAAPMEGARARLLGGVRGGDGEPPGLEEPAGFASGYGGFESRGVDCEPPGLEEPAGFGGSYGGFKSRDVDCEPPGLEEPAGCGGYGGYGGVESRDAEAEPAGLEEPAGRGVFELARHAAYDDDAYGGRAVFASVSEPDGYEDPSELMLAGGSYGAPVSATAHPALPPGAPPNPASAAKQPDSREASSPTKSPSSSHASTPSAERLAPVLRSVIKHRGIDEYSHVGTDGSGGLTIGIGRFRQSDGSLRRVLASAARRDEAWYPRQRSLFDSVFGPRRADALREWAWGSSDHALVDGEYLSAPSWREALRRSGRLHLPPPEGLGVATHLDPFKAAQNEALVLEILDPALALAKRLGLVSDRGLAIFLETLLEHGSERGGDWLAGLRPEGRLSVADVVHAAVASQHGNADRLRRLAEDRNDLSDIVLVAGG